MKEATLVAIMLALAIALGAAIAFPFMLLWNGCLVGAVTGVNEITYLQSWGIYILSHLLFKMNVSGESK